ncbi:hypothetical protein D3C85_1179710 [compost metagenome]
MEHPAIFGEMTKHRAEYLFKLPPDAIFKDPRLPGDFRQLMIDLLDQPYLRYMMSDRHGIPGTPYHWLTSGKEISDNKLRHEVLTGFNFAWHLMGGAWVVQVVRNLGALFAGFFLAETYQQYYHTMYQRFIVKEPNPVRMFSVIDDYLVALFANMQACFRKDVSVDMIGRILHFMAANADQTQAFCGRVNVVTQHINYNHTLH